MTVPFIIFIKEYIQQSTKWVAKQNCLLNTNQSLQSTKEMAMKCKNYIDWSLMHITTSTAIVHLYFSLSSYCSSNISTKNVGTDFGRNFFALDILVHSFKTISCKFSTWSATFCTLHWRSSLCNWSRHHGWVQFNAQEIWKNCWFQFGWTKVCQHLWPGASSKGRSYLIIRYTEGVGVYGTMSQGAGD